MDTRTITTTLEGKSISITSHSEQETFEIAKTVANSLQEGDVLALTGELGAGKTAFVKGLAQALGIDNTITSPTFVVMKVYDVPENPENITTLCHVDAYRLSTGQDLEDIGIRDYMGAPHTVTVIEWAERVKEVIPEDAIWMTFEHPSE